MQTVDVEYHNLNWIVTRFAQRVPDVAEAVVVSSDGLLIAMSDGLDRAGGDRLAAVAAGLISIAHGAGQPLDGGPVNQIIIEMERALLLTMAISDGSSLAVSAVRPCDIGLIAYEMAVLIEKMGTGLTPQRIEELQQALPR